MADALVSATVAGTMYAFSAGAAAYSVKKIRLENDDKKIPVMGVKIGRGTRLNSSHPSSSRMPSSA